MQSITKEKKTRSINVRLTDSELEAVRYQAQLNVVSMERYILAKVFLKVIQTKQNDNDRN